MKLLSLNIGIKINNYNEVENYIRNNSFDFVMLQEVLNVKESLFLAKSSDFNKLLLSNIFLHNVLGPMYYADKIYKNGKLSRDYECIIEQGNSLSTNFDITESYNKFFHKHYSKFTDSTNFKTEDHPRSILQNIVSVKNGKKIQLINIHGCWSSDKIGNDRQLKQIEFLINQSKLYKIPTIIVGDFNLLPNSKPIEMMNHNYINLCKNFNIKNTRPAFDDGLDKGDVLIDYIFVSKDIKVKNFYIDNTTISDHYPLILDFDI